MDLLGEDFGENTNSSQNVPKNGSDLSSDNKKLGNEAKVDLLGSFDDFGSPSSFMTAASPPPAFSVGAASPTEDNAKQHNTSDKSSNFATPETTFLPSQKDETAQKDGELFALPPPSNTAPVFDDFDDFPSSSNNQTQHVLSSKNVSFDDFSSNTKNGTFDNFSSNQPVAKTDAFADFSSKTTDFDDFSNSKNIHQSNNDPNFSTSNDDFDDFGGFSSSKQNEFKSANDFDDFASGTKQDDFGGFSSTNDDFDDFSTPAQSTVPAQQQPPLHQPSVPSFPEPIQSALTQFQTTIHAQNTASESLLESIQRLSSVTLDAPSSTTSSSLPSPLFNDPSQSWSVFAQRLQFDLKSENSFRWRRSMIRKLGMISAGVPMNLDES